MPQLISQRMNVKQSPHAGRTLLWLFHKAWELLRNTGIARNTLAHALAEVGHMADNTPTHTLARADYARNNLLGHNDENESSDVSSARAHTPISTINNSSAATGHATIRPSGHQPAQGVTRLTMAPATKTPSARSYSPTASAATAPTWRGTVGTRTQRWPTTQEFARK